MADDTWSVYDKFTVKSGKVLNMCFPKDLTHIGEVSVDKDCSATAWFYLRQMIQKSKSLVNAIPS